MKKSHNLAGQKKEEEEYLKPSFFIFYGVIHFLGICYSFLKFHRSTITMSKHITISRRRRSHNADKVETGDSPSDLLLTIFIFPIFSFVDKCADFGDFQNRRRIDNTRSRANLAARCTSAPDIQFHLAPLPIENYTRLYINSQVISIAFSCTWRHLLLCNLKIEIC